MLKKIKNTLIILGLLLTVLVEASEFDNELLRLVNIEREKVGLSALSLSAKLGDAAQRHAQDMATNNYFSHTGLNGSTVSDRTKATGYESGFVGENIAAGRATPSETMQQWMNSQGHRENILKAGYKAIGFGYTSDQNSEYRHYWVQVFGGDVDQTSSQPTPKVSQLSKSDAIFNQLEKTYSQYLFPKANTVETRSYYLRQYTSSPVSDMIIDKEVGTIWYYFNHEWHYFATLEEANISLCSGHCF
ncbi:MAG: CAP domain-containing protein [Methylococcales bacterium]|nr:CAP domain-containing protein [Methylococcales bacterium]